MKNKIKSKLYFEPPHSIKINLRQKLFPKQGLHNWKLLVPSLAAGCLIVVMTFKYLNAPKVDESYIESFFLAEEMLDDDLDEMSSFHIQDFDLDNEDDESIETLI
ncbi:MAG: hypothetical protein HYV97_05760 [Bdellovibrio sp.]|nr:hypothetical protein [Bdellovibrio sp.]